MAIRQVHFCSAPLRNMTIMSSGLFGMITRQLIRNIYILPHYTQHDEQINKQFIADYPFASLTACDKNNKPVATQIPLFLEEENGKQFLRGHIIKNTDHHMAFEHNNNVLAVFTGKHTYVSGTWYSNPYIASTWN